MHKIYLTGIEKKPGKSFISLGLVSILVEQCQQLSVHKLFHEPDDKNQLQLMQAISGQKVKPFSTVTAAIKQMGDNSQQLINQCLDVFKSRQKIYYFEGTNFDSSNQAFEYEFNLTLAQNLNCQLILTVCAKDRTTEQTIDVIKTAMATAKKFHVNVQGIIVNRVPLVVEDKALSELKQSFTDIAFIAVVPEFESLSQPTMGEVAHSLQAQVLYGHAQLSRPVSQMTVAAKTLENFLATRMDKKGMLIITPDDRIDIILGCLLADQSSTYPKIAGMVLTGGSRPQGIIASLLDGLEAPFPILLSQDNTYETATTLYTSRFHIAANEPKRLHSATKKIRQFIDEASFIQLVKSQSLDRMSPPVFLYQLVNKAKSNKKHIVLPEADDERILMAADHLLKRKVVDITLLGNAEKIKSLVKKLGLQLPSVTIIDYSVDSVQKQAYAESYYQLRKHKNIILPIAQERLSDANYFAAMMVYHGDADGMVSGAVHTTADTVRPALEIIKTQATVSLVSSVFIMCLPTKIMIYGDCAINLNPDSHQLAEIGFQAAKISQQLGISPKVAMLSYSSGDSGKGESVEKVAKATARLRELWPDLLLEGPIQYDAAVEPSVAKKKLPDSKVAGRANVLIFPDLNTGNNTYKAVQRESGALAIGPVLLGLNKPVNDLSRGCLVEDIINTVLITAIQAQ